METRRKAAGVEWNHSRPAKWRQPWGMQCERNATCRAPASPAARWARSSLGGLILANRTRGERSTTLTCSPLANRAIFPWSQVTRSLPYSRTRNTSPAGEHQQGGQRVVRPSPLPTRTCRSAVALGQRHSVKRRTVDGTHRSGLKSGELPSRSPLMRAHPLTASSRCPRPFSPPGSDRIGFLDEAPTYSDQIKPYPCRPAPASLHGVAPASA